jgi:hypothetical protein
MGSKYHSKVIVKMVKGCEEKYPKPRSSSSMLKSGMKSMPILKYESM